MRNQRVAYIAHPVGEFEEKARNLEYATRWIRFLVENTRWAILTPWFTYQYVLDSQHQPRAMVDCLTIMGRCDMLVLTGNAVSPHMRYEIEEARRREVPVVDLTGLGDEALERKDLKDAIAALVSDVFHR